MTNLLEQAISCDDGDQAVKIIQQALVANAATTTDAIKPSIRPTYRASAAASRAGK